ncbi:MAG: ABC transporter permease [Coriobacteriia bacterium]|nr:ABC transporter permease [Coriobacteriia bacterium]MCL2536806.1 ABC transporter permease [Coriobacteriia bacterium]
MIDFWHFGVANTARFATATGQHLSLVITAVLLSILLAALITAGIDALQNNRQLKSNGRTPHAAHKLAESVQSSLAALYAVPSLALFALAIPLLGIGTATAIIVLVAYNQFLLVRNFSAGLASVDTGLYEAARSLGCTRLQAFTSVQLPLAAPILIAGVRLATISTIGIATIAALVDAGGLGALIFTGLRTNSLNLLLWATLLTMLLALFANAVLSLCERLFSRTTHGKCDTVNTDFSS